MVTARRTRGLIVAAPCSGSGKTTVTLGLLAALRQSERAVQPFKTGPDYIDTGHHEAAAGRPSFNLDTWAMPAPAIKRLVADTTPDADVAIVEGVMGLFDGASDAGRAGSGSTADLAALLGWPVVLVLDVSGQTETAAALALGCALYRPDVRVVGVILNQVASARHLAMITPGFARIGLKVFGALFRDGDLRLPERHLGLVQAGETEDWQAKINRIGARIADEVDLAALLEAAHRIEPAASPELRPAMRPPGQRVALARDVAFSFAYNHLLKSWRDAGAEILPFSPLQDESPSEAADAIWLPGGYPELHAGRIAAASRFLTGLRAAAERAVPIHGECGGYMVLGQGLEDADGHRHAMAGLLTAETSFLKRKLHLGYRRARLLSDCVLGRKEAEIYGHEFHYATLLSDTGQPLMECRDAGTGAVRPAGSRNGSVTGSFFHFLSSD
ncbi:cobyrinate a,c-diamide synthase [Hyphomicrobium sp. DMF-1]|jgi:cobyrinic acid a,c-diamide synthase|nr:cobyrinate a,c-diamide synthase [Hyphomicrobium sp. DMF-1]WBT39365.1 cobyrinate a,c-diamide synthase [Hyphomicrobium sp. DMF-1]